MADLRETLLANAKAALEVASVTLNSEATTKPTNLRVYRHIARHTDKDKLPDCSVIYLGENLEALNASPTGVSERQVRVGVQCRAVATSSQSGDAALLPVLQWAEIALLSEYTLSGAAVEGRLVSIDAIDTAELADTFAGALARFEFTVQTKWGDPRQAP